MQTISSDNILQSLEAEAEHLASRHYLFMAANLLKYYDGVFAEETKVERLELAKHYSDAANQQPDRPAASH